MKKKGFTLIELLAVIVVLAIIALIATPIVLNLINNAKEGAAKSSATSYVKAVENGVVQELVKNGNGKYTGNFEVDSTGKLQGTSNCKTIHDEKYNIDIVECPKITVDVSGKLPESGSYVVLDENGTVTNGYFTIDGYYIEYSNGVAKVLSNKEKEQETLKMIDNLNSMISTFGLNSKYGVFHCGIYGSSDEISCHYDGGIKKEDGTCATRIGNAAGLKEECYGNEILYSEGDLGIFEEVTKKFDLKKYNLDNREWYMIYFDAKTNKITKANINGFGYQDGKLGSYISF